MRLHSQLLAAQTPTLAQQAASTDLPAGVGSFQGDMMPTQKQGRARINTVNSGSRDPVETFAVRRLCLPRWLSMKFLVLVMVAAALTLPAVSQQTKPKQGTSGKNHTVILESEGGSFAIEGPTDWIADRKVGRRLGVCCVYYPKGSWDAAETIM